MPFRLHAGGTDDPTILETKNLPLGAVPYFNGAVRIGVYITECEERYPAVNGDAEISELRIERGCAGGWPAVGHITHCLKYCGPATGTAG
jgi:hypothetical protein